MHGEKATGPKNQAGNTNRMTHGFFSNVLFPGERALLEHARAITTLDGEIGVMRVHLYRLLKLSGSAEVAELVASAIDVTRKRGEEFDRASESMQAYDRLEISVKAPQYADLIIRTVDALRRLMLARFTMQGNEGPEPQYDDDRTETTAG